ncbi:Gp138 family membrane-puncturing spike protein [Clostridium botulinum]|uniref:Gp138 family membrane-puncturing spike protein n=1 Tax=Clostridium botulinum TaxID=1491 RepID=UPI0004CFEA6C|nr:Gp138 family membrane-puncturing spike protein [Clostridium botulinum]AXG97816.1 hypothetical protein AGE31_19700 [Clostridium botulinum]MBY6773634.1 hypothetical protein [Clostridium botulinum]MBY6886046.1 hypothetical protein [Clostridium botulinum]
MKEIVRTFQMIKQNLKEEIVCSLLGRINAVNPDETVDVEIMHTDNETKEPLPVMPNIPLINICFGNLSIQGVPQIGQWVLVTVIDYDIDNIMLGSTLKNNASERMHNLNDAMAIPIGFKTLNGGEIRVGNTKASITINDKGEMNIDTPKMTVGGSGATHPVIYADGDSYKQSTNLFVR